MDIDKIVKVQNFLINTGSYERERSGILAYTRTIFKVNRRICCYMDQKRDFIVYLGKPSDKEVLTWHYDTWQEALEKVKSIVCSTIEWGLQVGTITM